MLTDGCEVAARVLAEHARSVFGKTRPRVGILENREWDAGITEMPSLARHLERDGMATHIGDPRELDYRRGAFRLKGQPVDILYRNMEGDDFAELASSGHRLDAVVAAFHDNRVVSGIAGDFDHKSMWEVLTSPATAHVVAPAHRALLRRHLLWTRLLRDAETAGPDGQKIDLLPWVLTHKNQLVLKPNRSCGGEGVTLGPALDAEHWRRAVMRALRHRDAWVVQLFHEGTQKRFPVRRPGSRLHYVTYGVISAPRAVGILGRACRHPVVNVSRGGGLLPVFGA